MLTHALQRVVAWGADEAVDEDEVLQVVGPGHGRIVDDEHELRHAQQPLQRLGRAVERRVPCQHLAGPEDLVLRIEVVQRLLDVLA